MRLGSVAGRLAALGYERATVGAERRWFGARRRELLAAAAGRTLDVGCGTGANLAHLPPDRVDSLVLLDPSPWMLAHARRRAAAAGVPAETRRGRAEALDFEDASFDTVIFTLSLCTIGGPDRALAEARRVLRPGGRLLVLEHVRAREPRLAGWQDRLERPWGWLALGCHPNRDTWAAIEAAGFTFERVAERRERRIPLPLLQPQLLGVARPCRAPTGTAG